MVIMPTSAWMLRARRSFAGSGWIVVGEIVLEPFPFRLDRNGALSFCFDAFSSREPVPTSLENALRRNKNQMIGCGPGSSDRGQRVAGIARSPGATVQGCGTIEALW
jgi:hypothetical protein